MATDKLKFKTKLMLCFHQETHWRVPGDISPADLRNRAQALSEPPQATEDTNTEDQAREDTINRLSKKLNKKNNKR